MTKLKLLLVAVLCLNFFSLRAYDEVAFMFDPNDKLLESTPSARMECNMAALLTAINTAASTGANAIDFSGVEISDDATMSLMMIWENVHMRTLDDDIIQKCSTLKNSKGVRGYEVSNIGVEMIPQNDTYQEDLEQEITVSFDKQGRISDFVISMGMHQVAKMMKGAKTLEDIDCRLQILHYVEQFRTAYCEKNKTFLENIFSDDALIITGRVVTRKTPDRGMAQVVEYTKQNKREYLKKLFRRFDDPHSYINVQFSDIEVEASRTPKIYGVTLRQKWHSNNYSDEGIVFLLWDFTNEDRPQIYVRTWQAMEDTHRFKTTEFDF